MSSIDFPKKCEGGKDCSRVIPTTVYQSLSKWCKEKGGDLYILHELCVVDDVILKRENGWCVAEYQPKAEDFASPKASANYEEWKAKGVETAERLSSLYDDKVTIHWNDTPSEARYFITIGVNMEGDVIRLLDFAKEQGII